MTAPSGELAPVLDAVTYVLDRAEREPEGLGAHLCCATEAWARLVAAEAALLGRTHLRHRIHRLGGAPARVLKAWEAFECGERSTIELATDAVPATAEVVTRHGVWVVHELARGLYGGRYGPSGRRAAEGSREGLDRLARRLGEVAPGLVASDPYGPEGETYAAVLGEVRAWAARAGGAS